MHRETIHHLSLGVFGGGALFQGLWLARASGIGVTSLGTILAGGLVLFAVGWGLLSDRSLGTDIGNVVWLEAAGAVLFVLALASTLIL